MDINKFFKNIANDLQTNNRELSSDDFYYILKYLNIEQNDTLSKEIENFFEEFLDNLSNSLVKYETKPIGSGTNKTNYLGFYVEEKNKPLKSTKVYFPVKYEYLISALKTTFIYLVRNNIKAVVKFHQKATNEGVVIEFYNKEDVKPFINYCHSNFILKDLLEPLNPFIVTYHKFGIIKKMQGSYIETIAELLSKYFKTIQKNKKYDKVSALDFLAFVVETKETAIDENDYNTIIKNIKTILNNKGILEDEDLN